MLINISDLCAGSLGAGNIQSQNASQRANMEATHTKK